MKKLLLSFIIFASCSERINKSKILLNKSNGNTISINQDNTESTIVVNGDTVETKEGYYSDTNGNVIIIK